jgi:hypothetical protein
LASRRKEEAKEEKKEKEEEKTREKYMNTSMRIGKGGKAEKRNLLVDHRFFLPSRFVTVPYNIDLLLLLLMELFIILIDRNASGLVN